MARVKKFNPIDKRPDKKRDFYGPLPNPDLKAKKPNKKNTKNINIWDKA